MKIWQVTRDYFDGDHDHGYYDYGLYETEELARKAAEKVVESLVVEHNNVNKNSQWKTPNASWKWDKEYPNTLKMLLCGEWEYISVVEKEVLTKVKEGIEKTRPIITYT